MVHGVYEFMVHSIDDGRSVVNTKKCDSFPVILGIESSCDDTAAAVVAKGHPLSNVISSQHVHANFGGVVPELASRAHLRLIVPVVQTALREAGIAPGDLDAVAATCGPGLAGSLRVGLGFARAYALGLGIPLISVNHLEGHLCSVYLVDQTPAPPWLCLIVSGGHTQLVLVEERFVYRTLGCTRDDAAGEAFDKIARLLGLGYPGGPAIDHLARDGDPAFHAFPRSRPGNYDFSFSGLKTSVLYYLNAFDEERRKNLLRDHLPDICASFQQAVVDVLIDTLWRAVVETGTGDVAIVGGVSANSRLRQRAAELAQETGVRLHLPSLEYCLDNAAMIAMAGHFRLTAMQANALVPTAQPDLRLSQRRSGA